jgi:hypothetical protein
MAASKTIQQCTGLSIEQTIFSRAVNWSKIVFKNTPCTTHSTDDSDKEIIAKTTDKHAILEAVRNSHPLLKEATFVHHPDWTVQTLPDDAIYHNLRFTIEDPDNSITDNLIASEAIIFATTVQPRLWKDNSAPMPAANFNPRY